MSSHTALVEQAHGGSSNGAHRAELSSLGEEAHETRLHGECPVGGGGIKDVVGQIVQHVLPGPLVWGAVRPAEKTAHQKAAYNPCFSHPCQVRGSA